MPAIVKQRREGFALAVGRARIIMQKPFDHQGSGFDAYLKFIEDDFLGGARLNPGTDGRSDPRPGVREDLKVLGDSTDDL